MVRSLIKTIFFAAVFLGLIGTVTAYYFFFSNNIKNLEAPVVLTIPSGAEYEYVQNELEKAEIVQNMASFSLTSQILKYDQLVKGGKYEISNGMTNWELVRKLRAGAQDPMKLRFKAHRRTSEVIAEIAAQLEISEESLFEKLKDEAFLGELGFNSTNIAGLFIPNTYDVYWTVTPESLFKRLKKEYDGFWNAKRRGLAEQLHFSKEEVITLASIVQAESYIAEERPRVAGVYMNRLKKGIRLQADPTVIYAVGDFTIKRVLNKHLEFESPYNTYIHAGLPPGPINNPEVSAIEAVLNHEKHGYYYFCANPDFSGTHAFSKSLTQHLKYAREYQRKLNEMKLYK